MKKIRLVLVGIAMGVANVIPGVSGGTIAIIFNIYDKLMECITINIKTILKNLDFLIPLGIGVVIGILGLSKVMELLFFTLSFTNLFCIYWYYHWEFTINIFKGDC